MGKMLYMGINGSVLVAAIICFRHFFIRQVPKRFFVFLWICAILRLLLPVAIPVRTPVANGWDHAVFGGGQINTGNFGSKPGIEKQPDAIYGKTAGMEAEAPIRLEDIFFIAWLVVAVLLAAWIFIKHMSRCRIYQMSLPVCEEKAVRWMKTHHSFRKIDLRKSEWVKSPFTYGMIHPVILLPSEMDLDEEEFLCIMEHEWIHIRRWDVLVKYLLYLTVCIYWFHPLVWVMAALLDRDIEMACDEEAVEKYSGLLKKTYAFLLIRLAESSQEASWPVNACFARRSEIEERIGMIMEKKKYSRKAVVLAIGMLCFTITTFTASAQEESEAAVEAESITSGSMDAANARFTGADTQAQDASEQAGIKGADRQPVAKEQIVELAKSYLGSPYMHGGTDLSSGVDSPGFVKAVYGQVGIELPADLYALAAGRTEIPQTELSAGDVVIYSGADKDDKFFHAGIYDGSGQVIHASNMRDGVIRSDLNYREISMVVRILE